MTESADEAARRPLSGLRTIDSRPELPDVFREEIMKRKLALVAVGLFAAALLLFTPTGLILSRDMVDAVITNWPSVQQVDGEVGIKGPIRAAELTQLENVVVNPALREESTRWIDAGVLRTDGYPYAVLSMSGVIKGEVLNKGRVGAVLIPNEKTVLEAFNQEGKIMFPLEIVSESIPAKTAYFSSEPQKLQVAFPEYRVFFYNGTGKTSEVDFFAYLIQ